MFQMKKKGLAGLDLLQNAVLSFVVIAIVLGVGIFITTQTQEKIGEVAGNTSEAYVAMTDAIEGQATFSTWLVIIAIVIAAVVVLGFIFLLGKGNM